VTREPSPAKNAARIPVETKGVGCEEQAAVETPGARDASPVSADVSEPSSKSPLNDRNHIDSSCCSSPQSIGEVDVGALSIPYAFLHSRCEQKEVRIVPPSIRSTFPPLVLVVLI